MIVPACFKDALKLAATQRDECTVVPDEDGWHITLKSTDNVSMCDLLVKAEGFEAYSIGEPFCFRTKDMLSALERTSPSDVDVGDRVKVSGRDMRVTMAKLTILDPPKVPELVQDATVIVPAERLRTLISGADQDRVLMLDVSEEGLTAEVADDTGLGVSLTLEAARLPMLDGTATAHYPLTHVAPLVKALPAEAQMCLQLSTDYPLTASCVLDGWTASMLVAPRIMTE